MILTDPKWKKSVIGVSFFQFQQAYNKIGKHEAAYGMFTVIEAAPWNTSFIEGDNVPSHPINCLTCKPKDCGLTSISAFRLAFPLFFQFSSVKDTICIVPIVQVQRRLSRRTPGLISGLLPFV